MTPLLTPDDALALLKDGNRRFLDDVPLAVHGDRMSRLRMAAAQRPIAAYLSCSDSRVAPELLFGPVPDCYWRVSAQTSSRPRKFDGSH